MDVMTNPMNLPLATPRKDLMGSSSINAPAWYRILSSDLLCDSLWHDLPLKYHQRSISLFCVYASRKLHYSSLVCCPRVLQSERHYSIAIHPQWRPERCMLLIARVHLNLIVSQKFIHERHAFKPTRVVDHDIHDWKGKLIFRTCLI